MYEELLNKQVRELKPSGIRKFFDLANTKEGVISLGVGEPDFATPWNICEAAIYSIKSKKTHYTANAGLLSLRKEICKYLKRRFALEYDPNKNVLVSVGGSEAIDLSLRAIIEKGDEVILLQPCYVAYEPAVILAGGTPKFIELKSENEFKLTKEELLAAITPKTKAIILNFPSNPTGGVMTKQDYEPLIPILKEHNIIVISDEIYAELSYEERHCSPANFDEIKDLVILISGFSKAFAMTGWRLGYLCANETFLREILKIHQYIIMCAPTAAQYGAIEGLKNSQKYVDEMVEQYKLRRNYIVSGFNRIGLPTHLPQGAFYIFPCIKKTGLTSLEFCEKLLEEENVACVPGSAFGEAGEGFIRVSYAYSIDEIKVAIEKIGHFMEQYL
ncbi:aminotransferase class I/II-fold pyridoxal phosphate-dependent enzyme [uncultured Traorella sp.]|mgnify:FL=1|uniref:aminotransferase class I/II-fold pyridoxal phosphate-dependent enzyme n=1 Tax=uncultured Traorella sp. TaxID=1929048 RepID=UPI0025E137CA|nr:aminotransferase class I/II-fold pyridoxal phosphate-dependent enzyme [uncultured Traorella sp.]